MGEYKLIIDNKSFEYSGIFSVGGLFNEINRLIDQIGYEKEEKMSEETVMPEGKEFYIELRPSKQKTNYVKLMVKIKLHLTNITDVEKEINGIKKMFQQGNVYLVLDAWSLTDYGSRWNMKPWVFFMKAVINKYIYKFPLEESFTNELASNGIIIFHGIADFLDNFVYNQGIEKKEEIIPAAAIQLEEKKKK